MNQAELLNLIQAGENSDVEFKRDLTRPERLAREIVALLNLEGGRILLGVPDDGFAPGLPRASIRRAEEWVMQVARDHVQPSMIPYWQTVEMGSGAVVGVISIPADAPDKPYKAKRGSAWVTQVRVGTTTRDATREEEERLYQASGRVRYGMKPAPGATLDHLDRRRLNEYFTRVLEGDAPPDDDAEQWQRLLYNLELATSAAGRATATVDGMLLFGRNVSRFLPQSGIRAICYPGEEPGYAARTDEYLKGALTPLRALEGYMVETGLVDQAWDFVKRNTTPTAYLDGMRRVDRWEYPEPVVREAVVNALVHRDYSIAGTDVALLIFSNRLEVHSPGRLPNTVTVDGMRSGFRYARNQTLVNVMRDYGYVDARGMGVRNKIIPGMLAHNGTEPDLIEDENRFIVRLWKDGAADS